jgi:hypothetical protein
MKRRAKMILQSPSDRNTTVYLPIATAWAAARGIARDTHYVVILYGERGIARFRPDGTATVEWATGEVKTYGINTIACIH